MMDDFNDAMATIDAAVAANSAAIENGVKIAVGTYTGDGVNTGKTISVAFPVRAVFIWRNTSDNNGGALWPNAALCVSGTNYSLDLLTISGNSFTVKNVANKYPELNSNGYAYYYVAIG